MWIFLTALSNNTPAISILIQGKSTHAAMYTDSYLAGRSLPSVLCTPSVQLLNAHPPISTFVNGQVLWCVITQSRDTSRYFLTLKGLFHNFIVMLNCTYYCQNTELTQNWGPVWSRHLFHPLIKSALWPLCSVRLEKKWLRSVNINIPQILHLEQWMVNDHSSI